jgi:AP endonuclease-2
MFSRSNSPISASLKVNRNPFFRLTEMKSSRQAIGRSFALPDNYDTFLSFPSGKGKGGYSGVSVYAKVTPRKAEEGLTGLLQPKPPLDSSERISSVYPHAHEMTLMADEEGNAPLNLDALDSEGRGLVVDFGLFVLINVYCPNLTSEERMAFKMNYHYLLQERVRQLIEVDHREVIVVGDINVTATPDDHCDGHLPSNEATFWDGPHRKWFREWLYPRGPMHDVIRSFWPDRKAMYTCSSLVFGKDPSH